MEFKSGDRVHVTRLDWDDVDFYGTLNERNTSLISFELTDCTNIRHEGAYVLKPEIIDFGDEDYYTLATDEEDTEEPVIQRTTDTHDPVNKPSHYMLGDIEVKDIIAIVADKYRKGSVAHNVASALEYQMRAPEKNGLEDIKKARKCLDFAIENWE
ncbi:DUF3310 domain-containing protein [Mammaliicoccus sciuri]|uniref:DUF3310 domain-containing protein n=1 Tax=Mammaliicoccus sciuri TaxID=1296 RepID=UPI00265BC59A|nr:DUF3310 domain-containing protein [Mammaliicoccus sciuri]MDO0948193.1 DUF3310 domain-containing protein [Mammaliicoccus sciuri]